MDMHACSTGTWAAEQPQISPAFVHASCTFIFHHNALIMHIAMCTGEGQQTFFAGTNIFYILLRQTADDPLGFTDDAVFAYLSAQVHAHSSS